MQSQIQQFLAAKDQGQIRSGYLRAFELFQEFSEKSILETIKERRADFDGHRSEIREKAEREVTIFYNWLIHTKNISSKTAYYYAVSLKSLLAGLPTGVATGLLFSIILDTQTKKSDKLTCK